MGEEEDILSDDPFLIKLSELASLHIRKSQDYGTKGDPLANVRASEAFGIPAWVGAMVRANDKMKRIQAFVTNGKLENEALVDSFMDLAVYTVIAWVLYEEANGKTEGSNGSVRNNLGGISRRPS